MTTQINANACIYLFSIVMLLASMTSAIDVKQFLLKIKKPKGILIGLFCQYGILPVTAFGVSQIFDLSPSFGIALVITGTCPGGILSNFWCFVFNSDFPLSIAMTTCCSILSFAFIAMNGGIYIPILSKGTDLKIDWIALTLSVLAVLIGIVFGIFIAYIHNIKLIKFMCFLGVSTMTFILIYTFTGSSGSDTPLTDTPPLVFVASIVMNIVALGLSFGISLCLKLKRQSVVSVAIESSNQNAPLAIVIILLSLDDRYEGYQSDLALNVPIIYALTNILFVLILGITLNRTGWLKIDEQDESMTLGKIVREWRTKRKIRHVLKERNESVDIEKQELNENQGLNGNDIDIEQNQN